MWRFATRHLHPLSVVEIGEAHLRAGAECRLPMDPARFLMGADVADRLRDEAAGMVVFERAWGLHVRLGLPEGDELGLPPQAWAGLGRPPESLTQKPLLRLGAG